MKEMERTRSNSISILCSLGLFLAGYIFYSSSLTESYYASEFSLTSWQIGMAQSAVPLGAIIGAMIAGRLADILGRQRLLIINFLYLTVLGLLSAAVFSFSSVCVARLLNGILAGTLYPLCAAYLTEMTPQQSLAKQSAILMFINCLAAPLGCILAFALSNFCTDAVLWRTLFAFHALPAFCAFLYAKRLPESTAWLYAKSNSRKNVSAQQALAGIKTIFNSQYKNVTLCLLAAWFLMDIAYYGINFFVPYLLQSMQVKTISANFAAHSLLSNETVWGTLLINIFFMLGALAAVFVVDKINLISLQKYGFFYASLSLFLLAGYFYTGMQHSYLVIVLFVLFNFALNLGPDVTTYMLSATAYPVEIRGSGHGFIAGFAKFGSFLGVLFLPRIQDAWGYQVVILLLAGLLFAAYLSTLSLAKYLKQDSGIIPTGDIAYETN